MFILKEINEENYKALYTYIEENKDKDKIEIVIESLGGSTNYGILVSELLNKYKDKIILKIIYCFSEGFNVCYNFEGKKELIGSAHGMLHVPRMEAKVFLYYGELRVLPEEYKETLYSFQNLDIDIKGLSPDKQSLYIEGYDVYLDKKELEEIFKSKEEH